MSSTLVRVSTRGRRWSVLGALSRMPPSPAVTPVRASQAVSARAAAARRASVAFDSPSCADRQSQSRSSSRSRSRRRVGAARAGEGHQLLEVGAVGAHGVRAEAAIGAQVRPRTRRAIAVRSAACRLHGIHGARQSELAASAAPNVDVLLENISRRCSGVIASIWAQALDREAGHLHRVADRHGGVHDLVVVDVHEVDRLAEVDAGEQAVPGREVQRVAGRGGYGDGDAGERAVGRVVQVPGQDACAGRSPG